MNDMAQACWEAIDDAAPGERAILVGCSVGSAILPYMHHQRPPRTAALVLSGTGYNPGKEFATRRIASYTEQGAEFRWGYTFEDFSPAFRATPMAHFFADCSPSAIRMPTFSRSSISSKRWRSRTPTIITSASPARPSS